MSLQCQTIKLFFYCSVFFIFLSVECFEHRALLKMSVFVLKEMRKILSNEKITSANKLMKFS